MLASKAIIETAVILFIAVLKGVFLLAIIALAQDRFSVSALASFLLIRRVAATLGNLFQMGASQTLMRYLAINVSDKKKQFEFLYVAFKFWLTLAFIVSTTNIFFGAYLSSVLFPHSINPRQLLSVTLYLSFAMVTGFFAYSILAATRNIIIANLVEFLNAACFLFLLMWATSDTASYQSVLNYYSTLTLLLGIAVFVYISKEFESEITVGCQKTSDVTNAYVTYGVPRGVSSFFELSLFLIGPWLLRDNENILSQVLIAMTLLRVIQIALGPIAQYSLVKTSKRYGLDEEEAIKHSVKLLFGSIVYFATVVLSVVPFCSKDFLTLWLGESEFSSATSVILNSLVLSLPALGMFYGLKGVVEARWVKPYILIILSVSVGFHFLAYFAFCGFLNESESVLVAMNLAYLTLGLGVLLVVKEWLPCFNLKACIEFVAMGIILIGVNATIREIGLPPIYHLLLAGVATILIALLWLRKASNSWAKSMRLVSGLC